MGRRPEAQDRQVQRGEVLLADEAEPHLSRLGQKLGPIG
jgi:hypothetical protein